ncbi:MAG: redoxin domain-containing protein [Pirellulaceae bacterium]
MSSASRRKPHPNPGPSGRTVYIRIIPSIGNLFGMAMVLGLLLASKAEAQEEIEKRFQQLDANRDGMVTTDELPQAALFRIFDADGSGDITLEEARRTAGRSRLRGRMGGDTTQIAPKEEAKAPEPSEPTDVPVREGPRLLSPGEHGIGKFVQDIELVDLQGAAKKLHEVSDSQWTIIAFTSTSCPISRKYLPTLVALHQEFSSHGVGFVLVNCIATDSPAQMKEAVGRFGSEIQYLIDRDSALATHLGATSTTDVFLLDRSHTILYHGAIDDQYGLGYSIDAPRSTYLRNALEATLDHRTILISATLAPGCRLDHSKAPPTNSEVTYHNQIARLLQRHCIECHRAGGVGPFRLDSYDDAVAHAAMVREVVDRGAMPPWFAATDKSHSVSPWINDRSLSSSEKKQLLDWVDQGMPAGDPSQSPAQKSFTDGWLIGKPDAVFQFAKPFPVKATGTMPYQNIVVETQLEEDRWVQAIEVQPGNPSVVHHVLVFVQSAKEAEGTLDDAADERGGYWGVYVPGNSTLIYPEGYAKRIPKGARLRFQMHYTPNGTATEDRTRIGMVFAKREPQHEVRVAGIVNRGFRIPPGAANHPVVGTIRNLPADVEILAFLPHMHLRGKAARYELISNGQSQTLLDVPRYDFNWQLLYRFAEPVSARAGDTLQFTAWYDNSNDNPANPDPSREVRWGPQTYEEMHLGYVEYVVPGAKPGDPNPLSPRNRLRGAFRNFLGGSNSESNRANAALFRQLDTDRDGAVTRDEVRAKYPDNAAASSTLFDRLDTDGDGELSRQELQKLPEILRSPQP